MASACYFERSKTGDFIGRVDAWVDVWVDILEVTKTKCLHWGDIWGDKNRVVSTPFIRIYHTCNPDFYLFYVYLVG